MARRVGEIRTLRAALCFALLLVLVENEWNTFNKRSSIVHVCWSSIISSWERKSVKEVSLVDIEHEIIGLGGTSDVF